jgi:thioredoxin 1
MSKIETFTETGWEKDVLESTKAVLVDFRAPWCKPCVLEKLTLEKLSNDRADVLVVGWLDISAAVDLAVACRIQDVPTLALFRDGKLIRSFTGALRAMEAEKCLRSQAELFEIGIA